MGIFAGIIIGISFGLLVTTHTLAAVALFTLASLLLWSK